MKYRVLVRKLIAYSLLCITGYSIYSMEEGIGKLHLNNQEQEIPVDRMILDRALTSFNLFLNLPETNINFDSNDYTAYEMWHGNYIVSCKNQESVHKLLAAIGHQNKIKMKVDSSYKAIIKSINTPCGPGYPSSDIIKFRKALEKNNIINRLSLKRDIATCFSLYLGDKEYIENDPNLYFIELITGKKEKEQIISSPYTDLGLKPLLVRNDAPDTNHFTEIYMAQFLRDNDFIYDEEKFRAYPPITIIQKGKKLLIEYFKQNKVPGWELVP